MTARLRLLLADDNRSLIEALSDVFEAKGYDVDLAYDGVQAVERVRATAYDCILMDIRMPRMSGVEAFKQIRKFSPATPVILMTAYSVQGLIDEALSEGVVAVIDKPLAIDRVLGILEGLKGESSVLIVDVRPDPSLILTLTNQGYTVASAKSVANALAMMATREYDVVLLNAEIQGLTTDDSIVLMKECDPKSIIILMSSEPTRPANPLVYASLHKPFKIRDVVALLDNACGQK